MLTKNKKTKRVALITILAISTLTSSVIAKDFPERSFEFVAGYGPGGGHDTMLRSMVKILRSEGIIDVPISVVNKPGGGSAVAMGYLNSKKGDGHYLMSITSSHITTPLTTNIGLDYSNFTPIARFGIDPEVLVISKSGPYKSLDDILATDKVFNVGGTAKGSIEHVAAFQFSKLTGKKVNYIPYQGDGDVVSALLSNQLDFIISNPGAVKDFIETDKFKAVAISTEKRIDLMPNTPTFKEQGINITLSLFRGVTAPSGISGESKEYLIKKMTELNESKAWHDSYLNPNSVVPDFITGAEFSEYLNGMQKTYTESLTELGLMK